MFKKVVEGLKNEKRIVVDYEKTAAYVGSGGVEVLSTPEMILLIESTCYKCVENKLEQGYTTVGIKLDVEHIAATPIGFSATAKCELIKVEDKNLTFRVEVYDDIELVGRGIHERYIINLSKFIDRTNEKRNTLAK